jgi:uncharacterized repeat protein (TIGR02543 family)
MNKKTIYLSAIVFLLSLFTACNSPESEWNSGYEGKAAVRVHIGVDGIQGRTVRPAGALQDVSAWELRGAKDGGEETSLATFSSTEGETISLETGTWSFTLAGSKDGAVILRGTIPAQTISLTGTNTLEFTVAPVSEGEGTVNLVIELPAGSGITTARVLQDGTELEAPITPANDRIVFTETYTTGVYRFSVRLYKDSDLYGVVSEVVYVWTNLTSEKTYTLDRENLNLTYVITYHLWDGETETGYYQHTDAALTFDAPTRTGYAFENWYDNADFSGEPVTTIPAGSVGNKNFYAEWVEVTTYTVTFDADEGSPAEQTVVVNDGGSIGSSNMPPEPTKSEYTFEGWYTGQNGAGTQFTADTTVSADTTVYAKWTIVQYTVTFDADEGSPAEQTVEVNSGDSIDSTSASSITNVSYSYVSGGDWTLQSDGRRRSPAISHNGVTKSRVSFTSTTDNASIIIQLDVSSESGYDYAFISQLDNTSANTSGSVISGTQSVSITIPVPTAGSHFIDIGYSKDYMASSGSDCAWYEVTSGVSAMPSNPTRDNYTFGGWYTAQNGGGSQFTADTTVSGDITVYARWVLSGSITINPRPTSNPSLSNESISVNAERLFSVDGEYSSYQWYWDGEQIEGADSPDYTLAANPENLGVHELSVLVTSGGELFSARCRVTITKN